MFAGATVIWLLWATGPLSDGFYQDFRGNGPLHPIVRVFGPDANQVVFREPQGLRIRLPAKRPKALPVGVSPQFAISGDFEITGTYEILDAQASDSGAGVNLRVIVGRPMREAADIARYRRKKEGDVFFVNRATVTAGQEPRRDWKTFPATATTGKLRLQRVGATLHFLVSEGTEESFHELAQKEFVGDDCIVRFVANPGGKSTVDVRLVELRVRAERLPAVVARRRSRGWGITVAVSAVGVVVFVSVVVWLYQRRRQLSAGARTR